MCVNQIKRWAIPVIALGIVAHATQARAVELMPGQTLSVTFTESGPPSVEGGLVKGAGGLLDDTLGFLETDNLTLPTSGVAQLFNGTTLLGTVDFTAFGVQGFAFVAPGSTFTSFPSATISDSDWNSILNGTINGILDITLDRSADITITLFGLGVAEGSNGITDASPLPTITGESVLVATPIPASLPLFAGGLGFVGYLSRRRKRSGK
jgi:hypothetical protein